MSRQQNFRCNFFMMRIKDAGQEAIHECTTLRHAQSAVPAGLDAITILAAEAGGH